MPLLDELAGLEEAVASARDRLNAARSERDRQAGTAPQEAVAALVKFREDAEFGKPDAVPAEDRPARAKELAEDLLRFIGERGLTLRAVGSKGLLEVYDPAGDAEPQAELAAYNAAHAALNDFKRENADALKQEADAFEAARIRDVLAGDDPQAIRDALAGGTGDGALTTGDVSRRRVTRAA